MRMLFRPHSKKQAGKAAVPPMPADGSGVEIIGGKAIPWTRHGDRDYWTVTYGSHDAAEAIRVRKERAGGKEREIRGITQLICHVRRGSSAWSVVYDGQLPLSREFKNLMQGIIDTPAGRNLMERVNILRHDLLVMDDPSDPGASFISFCLRLREAGEAELGQLVSQYIRWFGLLPFLADDIASGNPRYTLMLARIIEAQGLREKTRSVSKRIIDAALSCACRLNHVPTKTDVREEYNDDPNNTPMTSSDFSKALTVAGLAWLPVRR